MANVYDPQNRYSGWGWSVWDLYDPNHKYGYGAKYVPSAMNTATVTPAAATTPATTKPVPPTSLVAPTAKVPEVPALETDAATKAPTSYLTTIPQMRAQQTGRRFIPPVASIQRQPSFNKPIGASDLNQMLALRRPIQPQLSPAYDPGFGQSIYRLPAYNKKQSELYPTFK